MFVIVGLAVMAFRSQSTAWRKCGRRAPLESTALQSTLGRFAAGNGVGVMSVRGESKAGTTSKSKMEMRGEGKGIRKNYERTKSERLCRC